MKLKIVAILLLLLITPCLAAVYITASSFADPHPVITPRKDYYQEGEKISLNYTIAPRTKDDAVKIDGRYYDLHTSLNNPKFEVVIAYKKGGVLYPNINPGLSDVNIEVGEWENGLDYIKVKLTGNIPKSDSRVGEIPILWVNVTDADTDVLPAVKVKVVNLKMFSEDISSFKARLEKAKANAKELDEMGADVTEVNKFLKKASADLNEAEAYFNKEKYLDADSKLKSVEENLNKAEGEINKTGAEFLYDEAQKKLDDVKLSIVQFEYLIQQAKNKNVVVTLYEFNLTKIKSEYSISLDKLEKIRSYINDGEYDSAKKRAKEVISGIERIKASIESNMVQLQKTLGGAPTPTAKPEKSSSQGFDLSIIKKIDLKLVGIAAAIVVIGLIIYKGRGRFGRRKWDELR